MIEDQKKVFLMRYLIIGDIHGCLHTFQAFLDEHYDPEKELLVQLGDCVDRGHFIVETLSFCEKLRKENPDRVFFLLGNHEDAMRRYLLNESADWLMYGGRETLRQFTDQGLDIHKTLRWINSLPLFLDHKSVFLSHAGQSPHQRDPNDLLDPHSLVWARGLLKNLGKPQVVGHSPLQTPYHAKASNTYYIDTGAAYGNALTGVKLHFDSDGKLLHSHFCQTKTKQIDFQGASHLKREPQPYFSIDQLDSPLK